LDRKKEELKYNSLEALSICATFIVTFGIIGWGLNLNVPFAPEQRAKWQSKVLSYSLWQIKLNQETHLKKASSPKKRGVAGRSLASLSNSGINEEKGVIGTDPWGQPYQYKIKKDKQILFVWSKGPNLQDDSINDSVGFKDDDIGYVIDLKMKR